MKSIIDLRKDLDESKVTSEKLFKETNEKAHKHQEEYNSFVTIVDEYKKEESKSLIDGIPYALKDNFSTKVYFQHHHLTYSKITFLYMMQLFMKN